MTINNNQQQDSFQLAKQIPILDVLTAFNIPFKKRGSGYIIVHEGKPDSSFSIDTKRNYIKDFGKTGYEGNAINFIGQYVLNLSHDETQLKENQHSIINLFQEKGLVPQTQFTQSISNEPRRHEDILNKFDSLTLGGYHSAVGRFLQVRGFEYDWIYRNQTKIGEVFRDIGYLQTYYCQEGDESEPRNTQVLLFPCLDEQGTFMGIKIRRVDGKKIRGLKSPTVGKTGLLYTDISLDTMIIVEGETDYIVLKLLGYDNVVANLGGVQSQKKQLKELLTDTKNIVCLYDNDTPGQLATKNLQDYFKRQIHTIEYPIRKNQYGKPISDINDLYLAGYNTKQKWDKILSTAKPLGDTSEEKYNGEFVFLRKTLEYYDITHKTIQQTGPVAAYLGMTPKELAQAVRKNEIRMYEDLCYREGGKEGYYNTLDESLILKDPQDAEPILHPHIKELINNIGGHRKGDIEWIHQSILYKLTHINDPYVPALILYGSGGSGKGTLLNLLSKIFGEVNMQTGLGQKDLEGSFDSYQGEKLIVEFKEVSSGSAFADKKILDRIKGIISERTISVNAKFRNVRQVESIARFHFSSNHAIPLQLDSKHSGNRRFTVIETGKALNTDIAREMNEVTFNNPQTIREYIARLYDTYPDIPNMTHFPALNNKSKAELEDNCEEVANIIFERIENKYPHITRISVPQKNILVKIWCTENGEDYEKDPKFKQKNFDMGLSHRYKKTRVRIGDNQMRGYKILKSKRELELLPEGKQNYFSNDNEII